SMDALEKRMTALLNTAGRETAERLTRLEAALSARAEPAPAPSAADAPTHSARSDATAFQMPEGDGLRLDALLSRYPSGPSDAMPDNPAEDAPLVDKGFKEPPARPAAAPVAPVRAVPASAKPEEPARPHFDPSQIERPPRPQSSFALEDKEPFGSAFPAAAAPAVDAQASSTSTFVAAARRAQRARQEQTVAETPSASLIGRALARVRPAAKAADAEPGAAAPPRRAEEEVVAKKVRPAPVMAPHDIEPVGHDAVTDEADDAVQPSFLQRHRRPLLLAAALVAVSLLTLNLVLQRSAGQRAATPPAAEAATPAALTTGALPADDQSL